MSTQSTNQLDNCPTSTQAQKGKSELEVKVISFGYKQGPPPLANVVFDVRFLKNPYWVEELRPLTGRDRPVQEYVLQQALAQEFLQSLNVMLSKILPKMAELKVGQFIIALGCTGGQHRSATLVETLATMLRQGYPQYCVAISHRELRLDDDGQDEDRDVSESP
jgi:UPF0042 nucleotide-binding protein